MQSPVEFVVIEPVGNTIFVKPMDNLSEFEYQHIDECVDKILAAMLKTQIHNIVIDFSRTTYFGSSVVEALLRIGREIRKLEGTLKLVNLSAAELEVLQILRASKLWTIESAATINS